MIHDFNSNQISLNRVACVEKLTSNNIIMFVKFLGEFWVL